VDFTYVISACLKMNMKKNRTIKRPSESLETVRLNNVNLIISLFSYLNRTNTAHLSPYLSTFHSPNPPSPLHIPYRHNEHLPAPIIIAPCLIVVYSVSGYYDSRISGGESAQCGVAHVSLPPLLYVVPVLACNCELALLDT
jgi:hypothetical protein